MTSTYRLPESRIVLHYRNLPNHPPTCRYLDATRIGMKCMNTKIKYIPLLETRTETWIKLPNDPCLSDVCFVSPEWSVVGQKLFLTRERTRVSNQTAANGA
jgi:hypothetical protein